MTGVGKHNALDFEEARYLAGKLDENRYDPCDEGQMKRLTSELNRQFPERTSEATIEQVTSFVGHCRAKKLTARDFVD